MTPRITVATSPKPFTDPHIRRIQANALRNWKALGLEVLVFGDEAGAEAIARELGLVYLPRVRRNAQGTPLLSDILHQARERATAPWLMLANADILFTPCLFHAVEVLERAGGFSLVTGRRWDLDVTEDLDFSETTWPQDLARRALREGRLNPTGMDYFLFPKNLPLHMPDFAIGRAGWDNWMVYNARAQGWRMVDGTPTVFVVHQNHHYRHLPGGRPHYKQPESRVNVRLAGGDARMYTLWEATHILYPQGLRPAPWHPMKPLRRLELWLLKDGFPERGWKRVLIRIVRRKWQAALLNRDGWWRGYYRMERPCV